MPDTIPRRTTTPCPATVWLHGGTRLDVTFWLLPDPQRELGVTPLGLLLEEDRRFFPVGLADASSGLLSRDALVTVEIDADGPGAEPIAGGGDVPRPRDAPSRLRGGGLRDPQVHGGRGLRPDVGRLQLLRPLRRRSVSARGSSSSRRPTSRACRSEGGRTMASRIDLLVANLLQTEGEALYIIPGERLFMTRGTSRVFVGREPVSVESFRAVVAEVAPGKAADELARTRVRIPMNLGPGRESVEIRFGLLGGQAGIMICRPAGWPRAPSRSRSPSARRSPSVRSRPSRYSCRCPLPPRPRSLPHLQTPPPTRVPGFVPAPIPVEEILYPAAAPASAASPPPSVRSERPLDALLLRMLELKASDVHLSSGNPPRLPHSRRDGRAGRPARPRAPTRSRRLLAPIFPERNRTEFLQRHDTDFAYEIAGRGAVPRQRLPRPARRRRRLPPDPDRDPHGAAAGPARRRS